MKSKFTLFRWLTALILGLFLISGATVNAQDGRNITGSFVDGLTTYYSPGVDGIVLEFETHVVSTDSEWVVYAELDFPEGITIVSATDMSAGGARVLPFNGESGDGVMITWGATSDFGSNWLANGAIAPFSVTVDVAEGFSGDLNIGWMLHGDEWGAEPHTVTGTVTFEEVPFPDPVDFVIATELSDEMVMLEWGFDLASFIPEHYPFNTDGMTEAEIERNWQSYLSYIGIESSGAQADGRQLVEFQVWRSKVYQPEATQFLGTTSQNQFVDFGWGGLDWGVYEWHIVAVYELNESEPVASNPLDKDMETTVNVMVQTNSGDSPGGTLVTFTNTSELNDEGEPRYTFTTMLDGSGTFTWDEFRRGMYDVEVSLAGYASIEESGIEIFDESDFQWVIVEILAVPADLYVTPTGFATWVGGSFEPSPFEPFFDSFDDAVVGMDLPEGWMKVPETNNWRMVENDFQGTAGGEGPEMKFYWSPRYADEDRYAISPVSNTSGQSELEFSFKAYLNNYNANSYPYTIRFVSIADGVEYVIDELVPEGSTNIAAQTYEYTLTSGAHGVGAEEFYLAWVHDGGDNNDAFGLNAFFVDDVVLTTNRSMAMKADRDFINYKVFLNGILVAETGELEYQFGTNGETLIDGQTYTTEVAAVYSTGQSEPASFTWVYIACDNYDAPGSFMAEQVEGSLDVALSWMVPTLDPEADQIDFTRIYRNGEVIAELMGDSYLDAELEIGSYDYCVTFVYESGAESCGDAVCAAVEVTGNASVDGTVVQAAYLGGEPIEGATIMIYNAENSFNFSTDATGAYSGSVLAGTYNYEVSAGGYITEMLEGVVIPEAGSVTNDFVLMEFPYPAGDVVAVELSDNTVEIRWRPPSSFEPYLENFDGGIPDTWTVEAGGTTADTWHGVTSYSGSTLDGTPFVFVDSDAAGSGGVTVDEMLYSPVLNTLGADVLFLEFEQYYRHLGTGSFGRVEVYDGSDWVTVLNQTATAGSWTASNFQSIDVAEYANAQFQVRFHYFDNAVWAWYWAVDNVIITNEVVRGNTALLQPEPTLEGYNVYRTSCEDGGDLQFMGYTLDTTFNDNTWGTAASGVYKWGVEAVYAGNMSEVEFSNCLDKNMTTLVSVMVETNSGDSPEGTNVLFVNTSEPHLELSYAVELDESGYFIWEDFRKGTYDISVELLGFVPIELTDVVIEIPIDFSWILQEMLLPVSDLYVTPTGFATWRSGSVIPFEPFTEDFSEGLGEWTTSPATGNWQMSQTTNLAGGVAPEVRFYWSPNTLNRFYLTSPVMSTLTQTQLELSFKHFMDYFGGPFTLSVVTIADGVEYVVEEWVNPSADWPADTYTTILNSSDHGVGAEEFQVAFVFDGQAWNVNWWNIDDIMIQTPRSRDLVNYTVYLDGVVDGTSEVEYYQYEGLQDSVTYLAEVAANYTTGTSPRMAYEFTYFACENFPGPEDLTAEVENNKNVTLNWGAPAPPPPPPGEAVEEDFESGSLPEGWEIIQTNGATATGPTPSFWTINDYISPDFSPFGTYHAGLWWDYGHQDEWLITPEFACDAGASLSFWTAVYEGSIYNDHYYVKVSTDGGSSWTELWDATALTGNAWNYYSYSYEIDLSAYGGQNIQLAFQAVDGPTNDGLWYVWFLDNIVVSSDTRSIAFAPESLIRKSNSARSTDMIARDGNTEAIQWSRDLSADADMSASPRPIRASRDMWDVQFEYNLETITGALGNAGAETDGEHFYTARWASNLLHKITMDGNLVEEFSIPGVTGVRDMAYDGEYFYGSNATAGNGIWQMDFETKTLVSTIPCSFAVRSISYDPEADGFWINNFGDDLKLISRTGELLETIGTAPLSLYGSAYDEWSEDGPYLWLFTGTTTGGGCQVEQLDLNTGTLTGVSHSVSGNIGGNGIAGGLWTQPGIVPNTVTLGGLSQGTPDMLFGFELVEDDNGGGGGGGTDWEYLGANIYRNGELIAEQVQGETYTDLDLLPGDYEYCVTFVYEQGAASCFGDACVDVVVSCDPPKNLEGIYVWDYNQGDPYEGALIKWEPSVAPTAEWLYYDDGVNVDGIGGPAAFTWAIKFDPAQLSEFEGASLTKIQIYNRLASTDELRIYQGTNAANLLHSQPLAGLPVEDWSEVDLTEPVLIDITQELWIAVYTTDGVNFPAGCGVGQGEPNGDLITLDGVLWEHLTDFGLIFTWNLRGYVTTMAGVTMALPMEKPADRLGLVPPAELAISGEGSSENNVLDLGNSRAVDAFNVYRSETGGNYTLLATVPFEAGATSYEYLDTDVNAQTGYYYQVTAYHTYEEDVECESPPAMALDIPEDDFVYILITSVEELSNADAKLYPNPANNSINIEAKDMQRITVVNAIGQMVYDMELDQQSKITLNTASYEAGMYIVRIATADGMVTKRVTIVR